MHPDRAKVSFFRQSTWMMFATVASGACMFAVHPLSKYIPAEEYSVLGTLLQLLNWMTIPSLGLQMVFAQQTSAAITEAQQRQLTSTTRGLLRLTFYLWVLMAIGLAIWQNPLAATLQITNPISLWITLFVGWAMLWLPIMQGILQGQQNFLWLGGSNMLNAMGRVGCAALIVVVFHGWAAGIMVGALLGYLAAMSTAGWHARGVWRATGSSYSLHDWLSQVVPLTIGIGTSQFMLSADQIFVQSHFPSDEVAPYVAAGTLGRALVVFTGPLATVMFPKLVRSKECGEKTNALALTLGGTALLGGIGALGLTALAPLVIKLGFRPAFVSIAYLVPWFAWCMLPLAMANVLINNLMARSEFKVVPWLVAVAVGYVVVLNRSLASFLSVVQTLGIFNLILLNVAVFFTWMRKPLKSSIAK